MSFTSVFNDCTGKLAIGGDASFDDVMEMLDKLKDALENSGADAEGLTVAAAAVLAIAPEALVAVAAAAGLSVAVLIADYIATAIVCAVKAAAQSGASAIWDYLTASSDSPFKNQILTAASEQGLAAPANVA
jgi:hypothetical protein